MMIRLSYRALFVGLLLGLAGNPAHAASAVITGQDGWLFPAWESVSKVDNAGMTRSVALIREFKQQLEREHIDLVVMVVPMKAPFYAQRLPAGQSLSPAVTQRYGRLQGDLNQAGVTTLDVRPILQQTEQGKQTAFYRADYHWTAWSAENAADATAHLISQRFPLQGEPGGGAVLGEWFDKRAFGDLAANFLPAVKRKAIGRDIYTVRHQVEEDSLLIDDAPAPVQVIGNSFVQPYLGFTQKLSNTLNRPVTLTWNPGDVGPWATMLQYLESPDFTQQKPQVIVWQFNEGQFHQGPASTNWSAKGVVSLSQWHQRLKKALP